MNIETEKLVTIKNYAAIRKVSTTTVYNWIEKGTVEMVSVDGVKFIKTK